MLGMHGCTLQNPDYSHLKRRMSTRIEQRLLCASLFAFKLYFCLSKHEQK